MHSWYSPKMPLQLVWKALLIENTRKQATKSHKHAWKNGLMDEDKNGWISLFKHNEEKKGIELDF